MRTCRTRQLCTGRRRSQAGQRRRTLATPGSRLVVLSCTTAPNKSGSTCRTAASTARSCSASVVSRCCRAHLTNSAPSALSRASIAAGRASHIGTFLSAAACARVGGPLVSGCASVYPASVRSPLPRQHLSVTPHADGRRCGAREVCGVAAGLMESFRTCLCDVNRRGAPARDSQIHIEGTRIDRSVVRSAPLAVRRHRLIRGRADDRTHGGASRSGLTMRAYRTHVRIGNSQTSLPSL